MTLGEQLKQAREKKNFSQEELADYLGVSRQAVSKWENNLAVPQGHNMDVLQKVLELELSPKQEITSEKIEPKKKWRGFVAGGWIASILAAALLGRVLSDQLRAQPVYDPEDTQKHPGDTTATEEELLELCSVRFYDEEQNEVLAEEDCYNTAVIDSILLQWTGTAESIQIYYLPSSEDTVGDLFLTKKPAEGDHAALLNASVLASRLEGQIYFELTCGEERVTSERYAICYQPPTVLAYIHGIDGETLAFDEVEWVDSPSARATELGIVDSGSGFFIHNEEESVEELVLAEDCVYTVCDWEDNYVQKKVSLSRFRELLEERKDVQIPYNLQISDGKIITITEHYVP